MKIKDLIAALQKLDAEKKVVYTDESYGDVVITSVEEVIGDEGEAVVRIY